MWFYYVSNIIYMYIYKVSYDTQFVSLGNKVNVMCVEYIYILYNTSSV